MSRLDSDGSPRRGGTGTTRIQRGKLASVGFLFVTQRASPFFSRSAQPGDVEAAVNKSVAPDSMKVAIVPWS